MRARKNCQKFGGHWGH